LIEWLIGWLIGWLISWLVDWLIHWLDSWLVDLVLAGFSGDWWDAAMVYRGWALDNAVWARRGNLTSRAAEPGYPLWLLETPVWGAVGGDPNSSLLPAENIRLAAALGTPVGTQWYNWQVQPSIQSTNNPINQPTLCLTYAELGAALPRSGGEYNFLGRIYHPAAGFVSGWISATIGFAGPTALAAITFAAYATSVIPNSDDIYIQQLLACSLVIILSITHASNHRNSGGLQQIFTILKIMIIILFCCAAIIANDKIK
jgi:hypothetical protein